MELLYSKEPVEDRASEMHLFGQFTGKWATEIRHFPLKGEVRISSGEWEFGYALEGRAVIDVWQIPPRKTALDSGKTVECGLCVRIYDAVLKIWKFTFHGPLYRKTLNMLAFEQGDEIIQEMFVGRDIVRWIFHNVTEEKFSWKAIRSYDGGESWRIEQTVEASRVRRSDIE